jgi:hypothetical protein
VVQDHRRFAHRIGLVLELAHERVDLREAGLNHRKMSGLLCQLRERRGIARAGGAVQVEEATDIDMARLAGIEAVEGLDLHPGEEVRHRVGRGDHCAGVPGTHLLHRQQGFVGGQVCRARPIEEPCRLIATRADRRLQRAEDGQRIALGPVQQIVAWHGGELLNIPDMPKLSHRQ